MTEIIELEMETCVGRIKYSNEKNQYQYYVILDWTIVSNERGERFMIFGVQDCSLESESLLHKNQNKVLCKEDRRQRMQNNIEKLHRTTPLHVLAWQDNPRSFGEVMLFCEPNSLENINKDALWRYIHGLFIGPFGVSSNEYEGATFLGWQYCWPDPKLDKYRSRQGTLYGSERKLTLADTLAEKLKEREYQYLLDLTEFEFTDDEWEDFAAGFIYTRNCREKENDTMHWYLLGDDPHVKSLSGYVFNCRVDADVLTPKSLLMEGDLTECSNFFEIVKRNILLILHRRKN